MDNRLAPVLLAALSLVVACSPPTPQQRECPPPPSVAPAVVGGDIVATVDGAKITRLDVRTAMANQPELLTGVPPLSAEATLEQVIDLEVLAQRARAAHLEQGAAFREERARRMAQFDAWEREELGQLYEREEATHLPPVTEAQARQYFDANAPRLRAETRVGRIVLHDEVTAEAALRDLRAGASFDEVAARELPATEDRASKPWELAFLGRDQMPEQWPAVLDGLEVGQTSEVIPGGGTRFWILKVLERRDNPSLTFEAVLPQVARRLHAEDETAARDRTRRDARAAAHVVYARPPSSPTPPAR